MKIQISNLCTLLISLVVSCIDSSRAEQLPEGFHNVLPSDSLVLIDQINKKELQTKVEGKDIVKGIFKSYQKIIEGK